MALSGAFTRVLGRRSPSRPSASTPAWRVVSHQGCSQQLSRGATRWSRSRHKLPTVRRRRSGGSADGGKTIEGFLVHFPVRHEFDARIILDQVVERLAGPRSQILEQVFRRSYILDAQADFGGADGSQQNWAEAH